MNISKIAIAKPNKALKKYLMYLSLIFAGIYISGCAKDSAHNPKEVGDFNHEVIKEWNETFLQVERYSAGYRP
ncbi:MAG TPA: hypothetical protein PLZ32_13870, partial [Saprospiraceae bacterium]|nr:hypothetical protein [Saprospiraceae bacterium]